MDGWITIGTKIDEGKFDKQLADLDRKIALQEKRKEIKYKAKIEAESNLKESEKQLQEMKSRYDELAVKQQRFNDLQYASFTGELTPKMGKELRDLGNQMAEMKQLSKEIQTAEINQGKLRNKVEQTNLAYQQVSASVNEYKRKIEAVNIKRQEAQVKSLRDSISQIKTSSSNAIKSVARLALGVLSIASAYRLVSQASSTLSQYDKQYATNLEYIRYLLAQALAPVLKYLINLASTLLSYLNYIAKAWFNVNLFSKSSAKNFQNGQKSTAKMKKDLQTVSFDEMTVLQNQSTGGAGVGGGVPDIDPTKIQGEVPEWLKWIADNKDIVLATLAGIAGFITAIKLGLSGIIALGIGLIIAGVVLAIQGLIAYLNDPTFENFGKIIKGLGIALIGLGIIISGPAGLVVGIVGAIVLLWGVIVKYWEQIKSFIQKGIDWLFGKSDWVRQMFGDTIGDMYDNAVQGLQEILNWFDSTFKGIKANFNEIISFIKNVFAGNWKGAWQNIKNIFSNIWEGMKNTVRTIFSLISKMAINIGKTVGATISGAFKAVVNGVLWAIEHILNSPIRAINSLVGVINKVPGINLGYLPTFKLPRLKAGGIINLPGRGIPVGGGTAIGGEAGKEGVLPLTDTQAMETLGQAIGRYITINANITNTMNGRVISRQLQQIKNEQDFAYNT